MNKSPFGYLPSSSDTKGQKTTSWRQLVISDQTHTNWRVCKAIRPTRDSYKNEWETIHEHISRLLPRDKGRETDREREGWVDRIAPRR